MTIFSDARNVMAWKAAGMPEFESAAWNEAQKIIRAHTFALEDGRKKEVDRIFRRYAEKISEKQ